jgi:hypothetical protein
MVRSSEHDASIFEFIGENSISEIPLVCPMSVDISLPVDMSKILILESDVQVANLVWSGDILMEVTADECASVIEYLNVYKSGILPDITALSLP